MNDVDRAKAVVDLDETGAGGLRSPLPSGTPSMLVVFGTGPDALTSGKAVGAQVHRVGGGDLCPGDVGIAVEIEFRDQSAGLALAALRPSFTLWYGRTVGRGHLTDGKAG